MKQAASLVFSAWFIPKETLSVSKKKPQTNKKLYLNSYYCFTGLSWNQVPSALSFMHPVRGTLCLMLTHVSDDIPFIFCVPLTGVGERRNTFTSKHFMYLWMTGLLSPFPSPPHDPLPLLHLFSLRPSFLQQETLTESSLLKNFP